MYLAWSSQESRNPVFESDWESQRPPKFNNMISPNCPGQSLQTSIWKSRLSRDIFVSVSRLTLETVQLTTGETVQCKDDLCYIMLVFDIYLAIRVIRLFPSQSESRHVENTHVPLETAQPYLSTTTWCGCDGYDEWNLYCIDWTKM